MWDTSICLPHFRNGNFHPFDTTELLLYYLLLKLDKFLSWDVEKTYENIPYLEGGGEIPRAMVSKIPEPPCRSYTQLSHYDLT